MGGRIIHVPGSRPTCRDFNLCAGLPGPNLLAPGTQWQCDECDRIWVVVQGAQYNETYQAWRKLTDRNIDGQDRF